MYQLGILTHIFYDACWFFLSFLLVRNRYIRKTQNRTTEQSEGQGCVNIGKKKTSKKKKKKKSNDLFF